MSSYRPAIGYRLRLRITRALIFALLLLALLIILFPTYYMALTAFRPTPEINARIPTLITTHPTLEGLIDLLTLTDYITQMRNSLLVSISTTAIAIVVSSLAAYSLTRLRYLGRDLLAGSVFLVYLMPGSLLMVPIFLLMVTIGLNNTLQGLVLAYLSFTVPFCTWMLKGYFATIPVDLEEAGLVDGCNRLTALVRIVLPLALPGIVASAVFAFTLALNEYLFAAVLLNKRDYYTVPIGLAFNIHGDLYQWGRLMTGSLLYSLPALMLYTFAQRFLVTGLTAGSVKG